MNGINIVSSLIPSTDWKLNQITSSVSSAAATPSQIGENTDPSIFVLTGDDILFLLFNDR